ncbi:MAG: type II secretion system F family protein, partial [Oscillospiraceae bacterium]|nr:type II secretion system F family protein [Oscillospiraceae bacterium]
KTLDIMQREQEKPANKQIYREIYEEVQKGTSFSDAIKQQDGAFPNFFISMVEAGEASGNLDMVMQKMEKQYDNDAKLTNKVKSAMMYPMILCILCVAIVIIMFTFIMPTFKDLLTEEDMHGLTGALFAFSDGFKKFWWLILIIVVGLVFAIRYALKVPDIRIKFDQLIIKMKPVGPLVVKVYTARFGSTLASLYSSGIPMVECLAKSSAILNNMYVSKKFETVIDEVKQGEQLSASIQRTGIFESMFVSIIYVGEESGALDTILTKSAAFYQEESDEAITRLVGLIEPVMIIFMGVAIGTVIAGILPAIYNSMGNIS